MRRRPNCFNLVFQLEFLCKAGMSKDHCVKGLEAIHCILYLLSGPIVKHFDLLVLRFLAV